MAAHNFTILMEHIRNWMPHFSISDTLYARTYAIHQLL